MSSDIDFVLEILWVTADELQTLFNNDQVTIDRELYNAVETSLQVAEMNIKQALEEYEARIAQRKNFYESKKRSS